MIRRVGDLTLAAAVLSLQLAGCGGNQQANCGIDGVRPHPEIGGQILYTCYPQPGGHGGLFLLDVPTGKVRAVTTDRAWNIGASWSPDGHRIVYESTRDGRSDLYVMDLSDGGRIQRLTNGRGFNNEPSWSPDGRWIVFQSSRAGISAPSGASGYYRDIYLVRPDGTNLGRLTVGHAFNGDPAWALAGERIAFGSNRDGSYDIFTMAANGLDQRKLTFHQGSGFAAYPRWSPDGSRIAFNGSNPAPGPAASIYSVAANGSETSRVTHGFDIRPDWSPDGRWIVFLRQWRGNWELFVARSDGSDVTQLTGDGATKEWPRWRPR